MNLRVMKFLTKKILGETYTNIHSHINPAPMVLLSPEYILPVDSPSLGTPERLLHYHNPTSTTIIGHFPKEFVPNAKNIAF